MHESRCACSGPAAGRLRHNRACERTGCLSNCEACSDAGQGEGLSSDSAGPANAQPASPQALALAEFLEQVIDGEVTVAAFQINTELQSDESMSITGGDYLSDQLKKRVAAAKERATNALSRADGAFTKFDGAAGQVEKVAEQVEREADDLLAQIGQISNMPPEGTDGGPY